MTFVLATASLLQIGLLESAHAEEVESEATATSLSAPNLVIIFCDDLGYGDLGCYGHPTIQTPQLDRMAEEGMKLTQFYSASSVCTPSRAALMTGRLPGRSGMCSNRRRVLFPDSNGGIPDEEITLAEALKDMGYVTGCVGKWHLGHHERYLPTNHGFDSYYGIPYSNDMDRVPGEPRGRAAFDAPKFEYWNVPLMRDTEVVERPADQNTITRRYTEEAVKFIESNREENFFLYLAHSMPHVPLFRSEAFAETSRRGLYGDVIEEIDWSVGQVLQSLRDNGLAENTLVIFTSDNGPWLEYNEQGGSAGLLRAGKGSTWDGGMREPAIAWWPGQIEASAVSMNIHSTMDIFATMHALNDKELPSDRIYDSYDMTPSLLGTGDATRDTVFYYRGFTLMAVRHGPWKMHLITQPGYGPGSGQPTHHDPPVLYHLERDPSEKRDVAARNAEVLENMRRLVAEHRQTWEPAPTQLEH